MAQRPYFRAPGDRVEIAAQARANQLGDVVIEGGFVGFCNKSGPINDTQLLLIEGRFRIPVAGIVGGPPVQGTYLWPTATANGTVLVNGVTGSSAGLTMTAGAQQPIAQVMDTPSGGWCDIKLLSEGRHV